jgi:hypothetical protein
MAAWTSLYPMILPDTPGCPELILDQHIRQAAIRFLFDSGAYIVTAQNVAFSAGQSTYSFVPPADVQVNSVLEAKVDGAVYPLDMGVNSLAWDSSSTQTPTVFIPGDDGSSYRLWPTPTVSGTLTFRYTATPTETSTTIPDIVVLRWAAAIAKGAKATLLALPGKAFTNERLAAKYDADFRADVNRAKIARQRGFQGQPLQAQYVKFGA